MEYIRELLCGDCLEVLKDYPPDCMDSIVCDPPYGLAFMNKVWDYDIPSVDTWKEVLRVLKPGGYAVIFGGTRTYHRMAVAVEDAGFEIRDCIMWLYGSGFPKNLDVSKAVAKVSAEDAAKWAGWGTVLKPAYEPIILCRKPLSEKTVAHNVLKHGVGGLNIDACRVETTDNLNGGAYAKDGKPRHDGDENWRYKREGGSGEYVQPEGRWPANVIHDGSEEVLEGFPESKSCNTPSTAKPESKYRPGQGNYQPQGKIYPGDSGSAARFFYCAKAATSERGDGNTHPTVKPIKLMEYLVKMVTPAGGRVLDPFAGSGTTALACINNGNGFLLIEKNPEYYGMCEKRIDAYMQKSKEDL